MYSGLAGFGSWFEFLLYVFYECYDFCEDCVSRLKVLRAGGTY